MHSIVNTCNKRPLEKQVPASQSTMSDSSSTLNFDQGKKNEIQHHSSKERLRMSKTANSGC